MLEQPCFFNDAAVYVFQGPGLQFRRCAAENIAEHLFFAFGLQHLFSDFGFQSADVFCAVQALAEQS